MNINFKSLVLASTALCATAAFAATTDRASVNIPFSFTAEGQSYPAGNYEINESANSITMTNHANASKHIMWGTESVDAAKAPAVVRFDQIGTDYALKNIQLGTHVTPNLDKPAKGAVSATTSISGQ